MHKGFMNIGNTCYLNSGLQMLIQNKDLCNLISKYSEHSTQLKIIDNFINEYYTGNNNVMIPRDIKLLVENRQQMFVGFRQHDSAEFIVFLLDIIDEEIKKITNKSNQNEVTGIDSIFLLESNVRIKCKLKSCLGISEHVEKNSYLLLDINNDTKTLDCCYRLSKSSEILENNIYYCEKCKTKTLASKRNNIITWPNNLIIWLKRFKQTGNRLEKLDNMLSIPLLWRHNMKLQGFIVHSGGLHGGHYIYVGLINDKWYLFNDSSVSEILYPPQFNNYLSSAYMLYYKKI
jgi:ubiquitin C-terminal hydrolase